MFLWTLLFGFLLLPANVLTADLQTAYPPDQYLIATGYGDLTKGELTCRRVSEIAARSEEAKIAAKSLLKSHGCEAKLVTAACLRNLKAAGFSDYNVGAWLNEVEVEHPGQPKSVEWLRLEELYRQGPEGPLREYERNFRR